MEEKIEYGKQHLPQKQETKVSLSEQVPNPFSPSGLNLIQRYGNMFAQSEIVPVAFRGKPSDCMIAVEMAMRLRVSPIMMMQNIYVVHGNVGYSSKLLIASINASGRFTALTYKMSGDGDTRACVALATDKRTGEVLESPEVSIKMAKSEGWYNKNGSKWQTMPEVMLRYRAASFFAKLYCPEITMGLQTQEELEDVHYTEVEEAAKEEKAKKANKKEIDVKAVEAVAFDEEKPKEVEIKPNQPSAKVDEETGEVKMAF